MYSKLQVMFELGGSPFFYSLIVPLFCSEPIFLFFSRFVFFCLFQLYSDYNTYVADFVRLFTEKKSRFREKPRYIKEDGICEAWVKRGISLCLGRIKCWCKRVKIPPSAAWCRAATNKTRRVRSCQEKANILWCKNRGQVFSQPFHEVNWRRYKWSQWV